MMVIYLFYCCNITMQHIGELKYVSIFNII